jgi:hypothetical protein
MDEAVPAVPPYVFMVCIRTALPLYLAIVDAVCIYKFNFLHFEGHVNYIWQFTSYHVAPPLQTLKCLTLCREVITPECEDHMKRLKTLCR